MLPAAHLVAVCISEQLPCEKSHGFLCKYYVLLEIDILVLHLNLPLPIKRHESHASVKVAMLKIINDMHHDNLLIKSK